LRNAKNYAPVPLPSYWADMVASIGPCIYFLLIKANGHYTLVHWNEGAVFSVTFWKKKKEKKRKKRRYLTHNFLSDLDLILVLLI